MSLKSSYTPNGDKCRKLQMECRRYMAEILPIRRKLFNQSIQPNAMQIKLLFSIFSALLYDPSWITVVLNIDRLEHRI